MALKPLIAGQFYNSGGGGAGGDMLASVYDPANIAAQLAGRTVSNTFLAAQLVSLSALGVTHAAGFTLINPTAAAAGAQQVSPSTIWQGQGWSTDAGGASMPVAYRANVLPVQGSASPTAEFHIDFSVNSGAYNTLLNLSSSGNLSLTANLLLGGGSSANWSARGGIAFPANGVFQIFSSGFSSFVELIATTTARLQLGQDAAGVTNQMLTAANRITSDGVGANLTIAGGNGRGGAGGSLLLSAYTTGGAGVAGTLEPIAIINTSGFAMGGGKAFQLGNTAAADAALVSTHSMRIFDDTGTEYKVLLATP